jgi:hypothetical protein
MCRYVDVQICRFVLYHLHIRTFTHLLIRFRIYFRYGKHGLFNKLNRGATVA